MDDLLAALRAAAEPTRLRLLALAARGAFCVTDFTEILGQSQPRLSRHLKLLCDAGLLDREREGANAWFALPDGDAGLLVRDILARLPASDAILAGDRRQAARVLSERARAASESFRRQGVDWDEMSALGLPAAAAEAALLGLVGSAVGRLLDIGTGTGRLLELLGPRAERAVGMYRLPLADATFDIATAQMVLHHAEDPAGVLTEAARVLRPGGRLVIVDLAPHGHADWTTRLAHRWPGFTDATLAQLMRGAGLAPAAPIGVPDAPALRLWPASRLADMPEDAASLADAAF
jgi:ArsR family transcriptional regulator